MKHAKCIVSPELEILDEVEGLIDYYKNKYSDDYDFKYDMESILKRTFCLRFLLKLLDSSFEVKHDN